MVPVVIALANDLVQFMTALGVLLNGIGLLFTIYQGYRNGKKITEVHSATNGMKAELEAVAFDRGHAAGRLVPHLAEPPLAVLVDPPGDDLS